MSTYFAASTSANRVTRAAHAVPRGAGELQTYMKVRGKALKLGKRVRINKSGCLDRCELGPVMVIYPEGIWYHYQSREDIDEILSAM